MGNKRYKIQLLAKELIRVYESLKGVDDSVDSDHISGQLVIHRQHLSSALHSYIFHVLTDHGLNFDDVRAEVLEELHEAVR